MCVRVFFFYKKMMFVYIITLIFAFLFQCKSLTSSTTKAIDDDRWNEFTVSGISAGGFFATQFHVAFSSTVTGAGIVAGGPYFCSNDNVLIAQTACMTQPELISVDALIEIVYNTARTGTIDDPENLKEDFVYIFSGRNDTVLSFIYSHYHLFLLTTVHSFCSQLPGCPFWCV